MTKHFRSLLTCLWAPTVTLSINPTAERYVGTPLPPHTHFSHPSQRRFLAAFSDIQDITYESELMSRGRVIIDMRNQPVSVFSVGVTVYSVWCGVGGSNIYMYVMESVQ